MKLSAAPVCTLDVDKSKEPEEVHEKGCVHPSRLWTETLQEALSEPLPNEEVTTHRLAERDKLPPDRDKSFFDVQ
jgi:hypothetical protein